MNSVTASLPRAASAQAPALAGGAAQHWLARAGGAVWRALQEMGRANARRELLEFAARCESHQPELAKELRAAAGHDPLA